ncbi:dienelactone hydrolase [Betaproteobacteria bacterium GR16-43]|nr:dienelactone hydrolase [Betaproteobacteria bacterium GR16-43]
MTRPVLSLAAALVATAAAIAANAAYDPLAIDEARLVQQVDLAFANGKREIPLRVFLPADPKPAPVVLFSHGLGGSREGNAFMGEHWAARGYVAVFLQHPGSDTSVWKGVPPAQAMQAMRSAASAGNLMLRIEDVHATLDQLERWNKDSGSKLRARMDLAHVGMSGHSFGAVTTQSVSGQSMPLAGKALDKRIDAAILYSPSPPRIGSAKGAFAKVEIPWLLMTGTKDVAAIGSITAASRLEVFPALPPGGKYELVLDRAEHSAFTDRALPGDKEDRNPKHHRAILAISTAFWDAYLRDDAQARAWIDGPGARSMLDTADRWQRK